MLWWLIGAWVASGLLIPALWLLSLAGHGVFVRSSHDLQASGTAPPPPPSSKRTSWNRGQIGRFLLCGLVGVGALILLFIGSFSDPISTMGNLYSALADAQAPVSQPTVTSAPVQEGLAAVKQPDRNQTGAVVHDRAREADLRAPPIPPVWALKAALSAVTPPPRPERPGKRSWQYRSAGAGECLCCAVAPRHVAVSASRERRRQQLVSQLQWRRAARCLRFRCSCRGHRRPVPHGATPQLGRAFTVILRLVFP